MAEMSIHTFRSSIYFSRTLNDALIQLCDIFWVVAWKKERKWALVIVFCNTFLPLSLFHLMYLTISYTGFISLSLSSKRPSRYHECIREG